MFTQLKEKRNVFISESYIGIHAEMSFFDADLVSFTFLPTVKVSEPYGLNNGSVPNSFRGVWFNGKNILGTYNKIDISLELIKAGYNNFIIGTDYDYEGNAMAKLLQLSFIKNGIEPNRIFRVPLEYNGYNRVIPFWDSNTLKDYLQDRWEDASFIRQSQKTIGKSSSIGRRIAYMLSEYLHPPDFVKNKNPNGTSTITYLFKKATNEK